MTWGFCHVRVVAVELHLWKLATASSQHLQAPALFEPRLCSPWAVPSPSLSTQGILGLGHFCPVWDSSRSNLHQITRCTGGDFLGAAPQPQPLPSWSPFLPLPSQGHICAMVWRLFLLTPDLPSLCLSGAFLQLICCTSNPCWHPNDTVYSRSGPRKGADMGLWNWLSHCSERREDTVGWYVGPWIVLGTR